MNIKLLIIGVIILGGYQIAGLYLVPEINEWHYEQTQQVNLGQGSQTINEISSLQNKLQLIVSILFIVKWASIIGGIYLIYLGVTYPPSRRHRKRSRKKSW